MVHFSNNRTLFKLLWMHKYITGVLVQLVSNAALSRRRSRVRVPYTPQNVFSVFSKQSGGDGCCKHLLSNSSLKIRKGGFLVRSKDNLWIHKQEKRGEYLNPERRSEHDLSVWKPYREQVMEWHDSVKVACGGFSQVPLDSNIDSNGMHRCKKITSLMAFMTKV